MKFNPFENKLESSSDEYFEVVHLNEDGTISNDRSPRRAGSVQEAVEMIRLDVNPVGNMSDENRAYWAAQRWGIVRVSKTINPVFGVGAEMPSLSVGDVIECVDHLEWGHFRVVEPAGNAGTMWNISGQGGMRVLAISEYVLTWRMVAPAKRQERSENAAHVEGGEVDDRAVVAATEPVDGDARIGDKILWNGKKYLVSVWGEGDGNLVSTNPDHPENLEGMAEGERLIDEAVARIEHGELPCPDCNELNPGDATECSSCKTPLDHDLNPTPDQVYQALEAAIDVVCDVDLQNEISAEYKRQLRDIITTGAFADKGDFNDPTLEKRDENVFALYYPDIEVMVDRGNGDSDVEVRVWRNGKNEDHPFASMTFDLTDDAAYNNARFMGQKRPERPVFAPMPGSSERAVLDVVTDLTNSLPLEWKRVPGFMGELYRSNTGTVEFNLYIQAAHVMIRDIKASEIMYRIDGAGDNAIAFGGLVKAVLG